MIKSMRMFIVISGWRWSRFRWNYLTWFVSSSILFKQVWRNINRSSKSVGIWWKVTNDQKSSRIMGQDFFIFMNDYHRLDPWIVLCWCEFKSYHFVRMGLCRKEDVKKEENVDKREEKMRRAGDEKGARKTGKEAMKKKWTIKPIGWGKGSQEEKIMKWIGTRRERDFKWSELEKRIRWKDWKGRSKRREDEMEVRKRKKWEREEKEEETEERVSRSKEKLMSRFSLGNTRERERER